jgi:hypothetical protein
MAVMELVSVGETIQPSDNSVQEGMTSSSGTEVGVEVTKMDNTEMGLDRWAFETTDKGVQEMDKARALTRAMSSITPVDHQCTGISLVVQHISGISPVGQ